MTVTKTNTFETGLADATTLTQGGGGNSGGTAGDYFDSIFVGAGCTLTASTTTPMHGALNARLALTASGGGNYGWNPATPTSVFIRGYFRLSALPGSVSYLVTARDSATSASGFNVRISTAGALSVYNRTAAATLATLASNISTNTWYRLEAMFTAAGAWELRVYVGDSTTLFAAPLSGTGVTTTLSSFNMLRFGMEGTSLTLDCRWDDVVYGTDWIGPVAATIARPMDLVSNPGAFTTASSTLYNALGDADNGTYTESPDLTSTAVAHRVRLSPLASGVVSLTVRLAASAASPAVNAVVKLYQGATLIATWTQAVTTTATDYTLSLTGGELAAITDRTDLRVDVAGVLA